MAYCSLAVVLVPRFRSLSNSGRTYRQAVSTSKPISPEMYGCVKDLPDCAGHPRIPARRDLDTSIPHHCGGSGASMPKRIELVCGIYA